MKTWKESAKGCVREKAYLSLGSTRSRAWDKGRRASLSGAWVDMSQGREGAREGALISRLPPWDSGATWGRGDSADPCLRAIPPERRGGWSVNNQLLIGWCCPLEALVLGLLRLPLWSQQISKQRNADAGSWKSGSVHWMERMRVWPGPRQHLLPSQLRFHYTI